MPPCAGIAAPEAAGGIVWAFAEVVVDEFCGSAFLSHATAGRISARATKRESGDDLILEAKEDVIRKPFISGTNAFDSMQLELDALSEPLHARIVSCFPVLPAGSSFPSG